MNNSNLPLRTKLLYALGQTGYGLVDRVVAMWLLFHYAPPHGEQLLNPGLFGIIMFCGRVIDSLADPLVSSWSDNCRSSLGRRRPFLLWGPLPLVLSMLLAFTPPCDQSGWGNAVYLAITLSAYFFFFTFYVCPYLALLPELARNDHERLNLTTIQGVFNIIGISTGMLISGLLVKHYGMHFMVLIIAFASALLMYAPAFSIQETKWPPVQHTQLDLWHSLAATLRNRPFMIYLGGNILFWFGFNIICTTAVYYVTVLMQQPKGHSAYLLGLTMGVALMAFVPLNCATQRWGKRRMMMAILGFFALVLPWIYCIDDPPWGTPVIFGYVVMGLLGVPVAGLLIIPNAIVAELANYAEKYTGLRHEAMFFGTQGFCCKVMLGLSTLVLGQLLECYGKTLQHPLGIKLTGPVAAIFALLGLVLFWLYPRDLTTYYAYHSQK